MFSVCRSLGALTRWPTDLIFRSLREQEARSLRVVTLQDFAFTQSRYACAHARMVVSAWESHKFETKHFHGRVLTCGIRIVSFSFPFPSFSYFLVFLRVSRFPIFVPTRMGHGWNFSLPWKTGGTPAPFIRLKIMRIVCLSVRERAVQCLRSKNG